MVLKKSYDAVIPTRAPPRWTLQRPTLLIDGLIEVQKVKIAKYFRMSHEVCAKLKVIYFCTEGKT